MSRRRIAARALVMPSNPKVPASTRVPGWCITSQRAQRVCTFIASAGAAQRSGACAARGAASDAAQAKA